MLSKAQIEQRVGKLTASRVACLMTGDVAGIHALYLEMLGEVPPEDLSHVWPVRLGEATEQLNLEWVERSGLTVTRRGDVIVHPKYDWAACTLDGWAEELQCPVEVKHTGGREPLEVIVERYQPQCQWQMFITGASQCLMSVIMGASPPVQETIERDLPYAAEMLKRGAQFMKCVRLRHPPVTLPAVPVPIVAERTVDMTGNNQWASFATEWLASKDAAKTCEDASKILKSLVPPDAKKAHGHGVQITRNRANALSLREATQ
jgi:predicted phage-related endonuclease